jgi:hypothetical protein
LQSRFHNVTVEQEKLCVCRHGRTFSQSDG